MFAQRHPKHKLRMTVLLISVTTGELEPNSFARLWMEFLGDVEKDFVIAAD